MRILSTKYTHKLLLDDSYYVEDESYYNSQVGSESDSRAFLNQINESETDDPLEKKYKPPEEQTVRTRTHSD